MSAWQPIETAPKCGRDFLIAGGTFSVYDHVDLPFVGVTIAYWDRKNNVFHGPEANAHDEFQQHFPTHWMPLPEPPK